jgi:hypothetical protein
MSLTSTRAHAAASIAVAFVLVGMLIFRRRR